MKSLIVLALIGLNPLALATEGHNCRLIIQIHYKGGKKKVVQEETGALSHAECRTVALKRQLDSEGEEVLGVKVVFGFRDLSVLSESEAEQENR